MKVQFKKSFLKDIEALGDPAIKGRVRQAITQAEEAPTLLQVENLKKLKGGERYYRIRVGDYRLGSSFVKTVSYSSDACTAKTSIGTYHRQPAWVVGPRGKGTPGRRGLRTRPTRLATFPPSSEKVCSAHYASVLSLPCDCQSQIINHQSEGIWS